MRKLTLAGLATALALILGLDTPRPVAAQTVSQKVASCKVKMEAEYEKNKTKPHLIFLVAAKKACIDTKGEWTVALHYMTDHKMPLGVKWKKMRDDFNARFDNPKGIEEPGLVGMAETLLRELVRAEAQALLPALAAEKERIRLAALTEQERLAEEAAKAKANDPVYQAKKKAFDECTARNAATVADPVTGAMTLEICSDPDQGIVVFSAPGQYTSNTSKGLVITGPTNKCTPKTTPSGPVAVYEETIISVLCNNPDTAFGLKVVLYKTLVNIVNAGARTPGEKEFLENMREYVQQANIKVAEEAAKLYEEWKLQEARRKARMGRVGNHPTITSMDIPVPPDFEAAATRSIMGSALAIATAGLIDNFLRSEANEKLGWVLLGGTVATGVGALSVAIAGSVAMLNAGAMLVGIVAGPAVLLAAFAFMTTVAVINMVKRDEALEKIATTMARAKQPVDLKTYFNSSKKTIFLRYLFAKATSKYSPTGMKDFNKGCQACFYEANNYDGRKFCTSGRESDLNTKKIVGTGVEHDFDFNDKISSVWIDNADCENSFVNLYEDKNGQGNYVQLIRSTPELRPLSRGKKGHWNDEASSVTFFNKNAPRCEFCIHKDKNYKGGYYCASGPLPDLTTIDWSDEASSITIDKTSCSKAKVWLYEDENYTGKYVELSQNNSNFKNLDNSRNWGRKEWNNEVTSVYFSPSGRNPYVERQLGGCRVCLYDRTHYKGPWKCVNGGGKNVNLGEGDFDFDDQATSIDFQTKDCPKGKSLIATLFEADINRSERLYMDERDPNFGRLSRGGSIWNDSVSSIIVKLVDTSSFECRICLYEDISYQGKKYCTNTYIKNLVGVSFNDITSSIKVFRQTGKMGKGKTCLGGGAWVFMGGAKTGKKWDIKLDYGNIPNVGDRWNDEISSVEYSSTKYNVIDSSLPKAAGPNPWTLVGGGVGSLDISVGAHGLVWIIAANHSPYTWTGTTWLKMGSKKGTRIDASIGGRAWMVGDDKFLYSWDPSKKTWKKQGNKRATDVGVSPGGGIIWIVGGDESDKKVRSFGNVNKNKPDAYKVYYYKDYRSYRAIEDNKWTRGGSQYSYGIRVDVDMRGNAWVVEDQDQSGPSGYTRFWPRKEFRVTGTRPSVYGNRRQSDVSIGVGNQVVVAADAPWFLKGTKWVVAHGDGYKSIAIDGKGNLWGIATKDINYNRYPAGKQKIHAYGSALTRAKEAIKEVAARVTAKAGQEWHVVAGKALDISAGPGGSVWLIGTDKSPYQWTGRKWIKMTQQGTRIDVGPGGNILMVGTDKLVSLRSDSSWEKLGALKAIDVGVGANGDIWAVGTDGFLYKWTGTAWQKKPAAGKFHRIDVGPKGTPWAVSTQGQVWYWTGGGWIPNFIRVQQYLNSPAGKASRYSFGQMPIPDLPANDISVGVNGKVWIAVISKGFKGTAELIGSKGWMLNSLNVKTVGIAVDKNGNRWVISDKNTIHTVRDASRVKPPALLVAFSTPAATGGGAAPPPMMAMGGRPGGRRPAAPVAPTAQKTWKTMAGKALDISVGPGGSVWAIDPDKSPKYLTGTGWKKITGKGTRIDVGKNGWVWLVGTDRYGYHWKNNRWNKVPGLTLSDIAIGGNKAWAIGTDTKTGGHSVYRFTGQWTPVPGVAGVRIDVDPRGNAWVVNAKGEVVTSTGNLPVSNIKWNPPPNKPPPANDVSIGANGTVWVALKGGGTATWNGKAWLMRGPKKLSTSVAANQNGDPLVTTDRQAIWAFK